MKKLLLISSLIVCFFLLMEAYRENLGMDWMRFQNEYRKKLKEIAHTPQEKRGAEDFEIKMRQITLPELNRVDRCISCHASIEDPRMKQLQNPLQTHPGNLLEVHELERTGCTICHDGQGRAITFQEALAHGEGKFWEKPVLLKPYLQANCYRCHKKTLQDTPVYNMGRKLYETKGCGGCHKLNGKGGSRGPDLSNIGNASFYVKSPIPEHREELLEQFQGNLNLAFIYEAVKYPHAQPEDSAMVDYGFSDEEAIGLTVYLKGFTTDEIPKSLVQSEAQVLPSTAYERGVRLYGLYCTACHGPDGQGTHLPELGKIGPAVGNPQFLAIADDKLLEHTISFSRGEEMPAFYTAGGLSQSEIRDIVQYLFSLKSTPPPLEEVMAIEGNPQYGEIFFNGNCSNCHGVEGKYSQDLIGPTLNNPTLLGLATKKFWYETIVKGRSGTAMPAWHFLQKEQLADLIAYLETLKHPPLDKKRVLQRVKTKASTENGKALFERRCAVCHGLNGTGGVGPHLRNKEFQRIADAEFIFRVMQEGRPGTAMVSWNNLSEEEAADIIAYVKSWQKERSVRLSEERILGSEKEGREIFEKVCAQCHGMSRETALAPAILSKGFLQQVTDAFIKEMISLGRSQTPMRPSLRGKSGVIELTEKEINSLVAYIRSFEDSPVFLEGKTTVQGNATVGEALFRRNCTQCHGEFGEGGNGPAIGKKGFLNTVSDGFIFANVRLGRPGSEMKAFTPHGDGFSNLEEKDIANIVSYLRSDLNLSDQLMKKVRGVPQKGQTIYLRVCSQCHGENGRGGIAPEIGNKHFLEAASGSYLQSTMALGRHNTQMRSMMKGGEGLIELSSSEVNDTISYLKSLAARNK